RDPQPERVPFDLAPLRIPARRRAPDPARERQRSHVQRRARLRDHARLEPRGVRVGPGLEKRLRALLEQAARGTVQRERAPLTSHRRSWTLSFGGARAPPARCLFPARPPAPARSDRKSHAISPSRPTRARSSTARGRGGKETSTAPCRTATAC